MGKSIFSELRNRRFCRSQSGLVAIEYALILPIFILLLFSLIEFGLIMLVSGMINNAANEASRFGLTGDSYVELQELDVGDNVKTRAQFIEFIIDKRLSVLKDIGEVRIIAVPYGTIENMGNSGREGYGSGDEVVIYRIEYTWHVLSPIMSAIIGKDGEYLITARTMVKNESF